MHQDFCFREQKADVANLRKDFISLKEYNRVQVSCNACNWKQCKLPFNPIYILYIYVQKKKQILGGKHQACSGDNADGNIKGLLQLVESQMQIFPQMWSNEMIISAESGQFGICVKNRGKDAAFRATGAAAE